MCVCVGGVCPSSATVALLLLLFLSSSSSSSSSSSPSSSISSESLCPGFLVLLFLPLCLFDISLVVNRVWRRLGLVLETSALSERCYFIVWAYICCRWLLCVRIGLSLSLSPLLSSLLFSSPLSLSLSLSLLFSSLFFSSPLSLSFSFYLFFSLTHSISLFLLWGCVCQESFTSDTGEGEEEEEDDDEDEVLYTDTRTTYTHTHTHTP